VDQVVITSLGARLAHDRQGAIGDIYAALGSTVLRYLQRLVGHDDAEDVLQRVFYEVWRHNDRYDPSRSLEAWILGIARKRAIDHLRRRRNPAVALENWDHIPGDDGREWAERYARAREVRNALNPWGARSRCVMLRSRTRGSAHQGRRGDVAGLRSAHSLLRRAPTAAALRRPSCGAGGAGCNARHRSAGYG
jgi:RNA polymerase sigma factor (sigma-70 family)